MRRGSILSIALILLTILTGCPSAPETPTGILSLQLSDSIPDSAVITVEVNGIEYQLSKETVKEPINIQLPIGAYSVKYSVEGVDSGTIITDPADTSSVVIQNGQTNLIRFSYQEPTPEPEPKKGTVTLTVEDEKNLLNGRSIGIKLGEQIIPVNSIEGNKIELELGDYYISIPEVPDDLLYTLSESKISLTESNLTVTVTVTVTQATGTLNVKLERDNPNEPVIINAGEKELGSLNYGETKSFTLAVGNYQLSVSSIDGYTLTFDKSSVSILKGQTTNVVLTSTKMEEDKGSIVITLNTSDIKEFPSNAAVNIFVGENNPEVLSANKTTVTYTVKPDTYTVSASATGLDKYVLTGIAEQQVTVEKGKTVNLEIAVSDKGKMHINVTDLDPKGTFTLKVLSGTDVIESIPSAELANKELSLPFGSYTFTYDYTERNPGVVLPDGSINVVAGETTEITVASLYNQGYGYVKASIVPEVAGVTGFEARVGGQTLTFDNPDCWLPEGIYPVEVVSVLGLPDTYVAEAEAITVASKEDTAVNITFKQKPGSGGIEIEDNIIGNLEVKIEGLKTVYSSSETLKATAVITVPEGKTATYQWYLGKEQISTSRDLSFSLVNTAAKKYSLSCFVYIDDALYSADSEIKVKD